MSMLREDILADQIMWSLLSSGQSPAETCMNIQARKDERLVRYSLMAAETARILVASMGMASLAIERREHR